MRPGHIGSSDLIRSAWSRWVRLRSIVVSRTRRHRVSCPRRKWPSRARGSLIRGSRGHGIARRRVVALRTRAPILVIRSLGRRRRRHALALCLTRMIRVARWVLPRMTRRRRVLVIPLGLSRRGRSKVVLWSRIGRPRSLVVRILIFRLVRLALGLDHAACSRSLLIIQFRLLTLRILSHPYFQPLFRKRLGEVGSS